MDNLTRSIELRENERIDDLQRNGYRIIQNSEKFCFGMDAVLLSGFARVKTGARVLDMGTGTGIIPILLEGKTKAAHLTGLEIQEESADMARRSILLNHLEKKIDIVTGDIKEAGNLFQAASFDVILFLHVRKGARIFLILVKCYVTMHYTADAKGFYFFITCYS